MKISSQNEFAKFLKANGFRNEGGRKHDKWTNGSYSFPLSKDKKGFSRMLAERMIKQVGLWTAYQKG